MHLDASADLAKIVLSLLGRGQLRALGQDLGRGINRRFHPQGDGDSVAGAGVDLKFLPSKLHGDDRVVDIVAQIGNRDAVDGRSDALEDIADEIVGVGARRREILHLDRNRGGFFVADPNGDELFVLDALQDHDGGRCFGGGVKHDPLYLHLHHCLIFRSARIVSEKTENRQSNQQAPLFHGRLL